MQRLLFLLIPSIIFIFSMTGCSQKASIHKHTKHTSAARHKATMKSYNVLGKRYHPTYVSVGQVQHGISSWYGPNFHGKYTSNGEIYNMHARTAAHKTWPMDTMVRVKNLKNGKSTLVRINDRGPFVKGRIIDCSYTAGKEIGLDKLGITKVDIKVVGFAGKVHSVKTIAKQKQSNTQTRVQLSSVGIQIAAFTRPEGAEVIKREYIGKYANYHPIVKTILDASGITLHQVWLMGFGSEQEARDFKDNNDLLYSTFIVRK